MDKVSRRALARWAADQLQAGADPKQIGQKLASILVETGLKNQTEYLLDDILFELEDRQKLSTATVTTARPISKELEDQLREAIKKSTNTDQVLIENNVDKTVIGGVRIQTPTKVWDGTVSKKLADLREVF